MSANKDLRFGFFPGGKMKCLTLSYDDSHDYNLRLVEIFNKYNIRATFHLNSGGFDKEGNLKSAEIAEVFAGHEISAHSYNHPYLERLPMMSALNQILDDRKGLEALAGYPVRGMSYPFGTYDQRVVEMLKTAGIEYSRTTIATNNFTLPDNFLTWHPTCHHTHNCFEVLDKFRDYNRPFGLFYMWGHAFEFERNLPNNNWEMIEDFCKKAADWPDVWYATNIEIIDYINAVRSIKLSADCSIIHNPSATEVWFSIDNNNTSIKPGETLKF